MLGGGGCCQCSKKRGSVAFLWSVDKEAQPHVAVGNGKNFKRIGHKDINIFKFLLVEQQAFDEKMVPVGAERPASSSFVGKSMILSGECQNVSVPSTIKNSFSYFSKRLKRAKRNFSQIWM